MSNYMPGTRVVFTEDNLGLIGAKATVSKGDHGTVIGPGPDEGWIYVEPDNHRSHICPVSAGMIEAVA